jgi:FkbM family methyltransferase
MFRVIKKIGIYWRRCGSITLCRILFLLVLAKLLARRFVKWSAKFQVQSLKLGGLRYPIYVRPGTSDIEVMQQVLLDQEYDFKLPIRPKVIIDAGANIGFASVYFASLYPEATIVALEPDASNFKLLQMNVADYPQIRPVEAALWCENKQLNLFSVDGAHAGIYTREGGAESRPKLGQVPAITLEEVMKTNGFQTIDLLKMDIEGAEKEVLEKSSAWIDKVGVFLIELHDHYKAGCSEAFNRATSSFQPEVVKKGETILRCRKTAA